MFACVHVSYELHTCLLVCVCRMSSVHVCLYACVCQEERYTLQTKAQVLSRKVWDLLMVLPTNPKIVHGFKDIGALVHHPNLTSCDGFGPINKAVFTFEAYGWSFSQRTGICVVL